MVKIRLRRVGRKNAPFYRILVADSQSPRDGKFIEIIGQYAPRKSEGSLNVDEARANYWLDQGAQPTDTVRSLLRRAGVLKGRHEKRIGFERKGVAVPVRETSDDLRASKLFLNVRAEYAIVWLIAKRGIRGEVVIEPLTTSRKWSSRPAAVFFRSADGDLTIGGRERCGRDAHPYRGCNQALQEGTHRTVCGAPDRDSASSGADDICWAPFSELPHCRPTRSIFTT